MRRYRINGGFSISFAACVIAALGVMIVPLRWLGAALLAGLVHEVSHYLMIRLCGGQVDRIAVDWDGVTMETAPLSPLKEILCTLAGPVGELCLVLAFRHLPRTAICAVFHAAYNLLPIYPMDGGRVLRCMLHMLFSQATAEKISVWISAVIPWAFVALGFIAAIWMKMGIMPIIFSFILWRKTRSRKIPCKPGQQRVQYIY